MFRSKPDALFLYIFRKVEQDDVFQMNIASVTQNQAKKQMNASK